MNSLTTSQFISEKYQKRCNEKGIEKACKKISPELEKKIIAKGYFYTFDIDGLTPRILKVNALQDPDGNLKLPNFIQLKVYSRFMGIVEVRKDEGEFTKLLDKLIDTESQITELIKSICDNVSVIDNGIFKFDSIDDPIKMILTNCCLTKECLFIGV